MNALRSPLGRSVRIGSLVALSLLLLLVPRSAAQDENKEAPHPAHIHNGTCDQLGDVAYPLADVAAPTGDQMGSAAANPVTVSEANHVDVPLQKLLDGDYAINVHESAEDIGTYIACGNIGGIVNKQEGRDGMELVIGLAELNDSGHVGVAWLGDDGKGGTDVTVTLIEPEEMSSSGYAAEATPIS